MNDTPALLPRLFLVDNLNPKAFVTLNSTQSHYLTRVLRCREGDKVRLFNGRDGEWLATLTAGPKNTVTLQLLEQSRGQDKAGDLWVCPALLKKGPFDFLVMKATELGASVIQPLLTSRTQVRQANTARLLTIAIEAAEQSERLTIPDIRAPLLLEDLLANWDAQRLALLCAEFGNATPIATALQTQTQKPATILTGPEGGWTEQEIKQIRALPEVLPLRLGRRILRAETAALSCIALWQALCGDWTRS
ncbi:MAG: 16S rRNA (uracil(1498)-N(3))-methyltransferase [Alphaproteobacteria bacterium]|nr:16S rRNA (uracil(1498)-N(3))-methyltransferase [Alphaproteobacteria bacterium]